MAAARMPSELRHLHLLLLLMPLLFHLLHLHLHLHLHVGASSAPKYAERSTDRNVTYDERAIVIDGQRKLLISASIHYPRSTPEMWGDLMAKAKLGGVDVIESYMFWGMHEPSKGQFNFEGNLDLVRFIKEAQNAGLYFHLRIGPYACAEWNYGGFPVWLHFIPGIQLRTDNPIFKYEMERITTKIVDLLKSEKLFYWQGGPVILAQIENEYGNIDKPYGKAGKRYMQWAAEMAVGLDTGVPWVMCQQSDAPDIVINTCNGFYCDQFEPNSPNKPKIWTENWTGWFLTFGGLVPHRPVEDIAYAVARFYQTGGTFQNYYMYHGGTNFGRISGGPFIATSYDYDAPIDEYGLLNQPKWGHLSDLHKALRRCEKALLYGDSHNTSLGPLQEATIYNASDNNSCAFLSNKDPKHDSKVLFNGQTYLIPAWSVSILHECKYVIYNTAMIKHQTTIKHMSAITQTPLIWESYLEPIGAWSKSSFISNGLKDQMNTTRDSSDYMWYITRFNSTTYTKGTLSINSLGDSALLFLNKEVLGHVHGSSEVPMFEFKIPLQSKYGQNELAILSSTVGLKNYGAFFDTTGTGLNGKISLTMANESIDLSTREWTYQIGLQGEEIELPLENPSFNTKWMVAQTIPRNQPMTWYKTRFSSPSGNDPVALDLTTMGKGQAWINGRALGRYWSSYIQYNSTCEHACDYRGTYTPTKCVTECGEPSQKWFHIPRSWLKPFGNRLTLFEEVGGDPTKVSFGTRAIREVCSLISGEQPSLDVNSTSPTMTLHCGQQQTIASIHLANYGNPQGSCVYNTLKEGSCNSPKFIDIVKEACVGKQGCSLDFSTIRNQLEDPCPEVSKSIAVHAMCSNE